MKFDYRVTRIEEEVGLETTDACPHLPPVYVYEDDVEPERCDICSRDPVTILIRFVDGDEWNHRSTSVG